MGGAIMPNINEVIKKIGCPMVNQFTHEFVSEPEYKIEKRGQVSSVTPWIVYKEGFVMGAFCNPERAENYIELLKFADKIYQMNHKDI